jgi:hypothetical protein
MQSTTTSSSRRYDLLSVEGFRQEQEQEQEQEIVLPS